MAKPKSKEFRQQIVQAYKNKEGSIRELAKKFKISPDFVFRMIKLSKIDPELKPKPHTGGKGPKIPTENLSFLENLISIQPDLVLYELCELYNEKFNDDVANTAMLNALKRLNITRKKNIF